jgi:hypothetical protein
VKGVKCWYINRMGQVLNVMDDIGTEGPRLPSNFGEMINEERKGKRRWLREIK